jgi:hypothetical protein
LLGNACGQFCPARLESERIRSASLEEHLFSDSLEENDWRLMGQIKYLAGKEMVCKKWKRPREEWDHDHCEFCWEKIDETSSEAYCTEDERHWVCDECFEDFREMFGWKLTAGK